LAVASVIYNGMSFLLITSPARAVVKYYDECDECVCLSVREDISGTTRAILPIFVHVACVRGSVFLRHVYDRPHRLSPGRDLSSPLTVHCNALAAKGIIRSPITSCSTRDHSVVATFAENGIGREGVTGVHSAGEV